MSIMRDRREEYFEKVFYRTDEFGKWKYFINNGNIEAIKRLEDNSEKLKK